MHLTRVHNMDGLYRYQQLGRRIGYLLCSAMRSFWRELKVTLTLTRMPSINSHFLQKTALFRLEKKPRSPSVFNLARYLGIRNESDEGNLVTLSVTHCFLREIWLAETATRTEM